MKRIMVVEDQAVLSGAYREGLEKAGYEVVLARNTDDASELLTKKKPDLIVLDLILPGKSGFVFLEEVKKNSEFDNIPVIVASNLGGEDDEEKALEMGAVDYLAKSDVSLDDLIERIKKALQ